MRARETQLSAILWSRGLINCSDSVCSLRPEPFSYLCVRVRILCVLKIVCGWANKTWLLPYACCGLHFSWLCCLCPVLLPLHSITFVTAVLPLVALHIYLQVQGHMFSSRGHMPRHPLLKKRNYHLIIQVRHCLLNHLRQVFGTTFAGKIYQSQ